MLYLPQKPYVQEVDLHEATICFICWDQVNQFHKFYVFVEELHQSRLASVIVKSEPAVTENDGLEECPPEKSDRELHVEPQEQEASIIFKEEPALEIVDEIATDSEQLSDERKTRHRPKKRRLVSKSKKEIRMEDDYIGQHVKFTCKQCGDDSSPSYELFTKHCINAHGEKYPPLECCGQLFSRKQLLYEHVQYINNRSFFRCEPCGKAFSYKYGLERHQKTVHASKEEMKVKCEWCPRSFPLQSACRSHMMSHLLRFHCPECPSKFNKAQQLVDHVTKVHPGISPYKCPFCERTFNTYVILHKHERAMHPEDWRQAEKNSKPPTSTKDSLPQVIEREFIDAAKKSQLVDACIGEHVKFSCKLCAENFPNFTQYVYHCEEEHGDKSPSIECCGKQFTRKFRLYEHVRVTKNPDMLRCKMCPKSFATLFRIDQHMKVVHASKEERKFKCDRCPRAFAIRAVFSKHYKRHIPQKESEQKLRFPCNCCPSIFSSSRYLKDHAIAVHPGIDPFQCPFCRITFKQNKSFSRHVTRMHPKELRDRVAKDQKRRLKSTVTEGDKNINDNPVKLSIGYLDDTSQQQETTISEEDGVDLSTDDESGSGCVPSKDRKHFSYSYLTSSDQPAVGSRGEILEEPFSETSESTLGNLKNESRVKRKTMEQMRIEDEIIGKHAKFVCKECGLESLNYTRHMQHALRGHDNTYPFVECCGKQFNSRQNLLEHVKVINNPYIFRCKVCRRNFTNSIGIQRHMKTFHSSEEEKKFKCEQCPQSFVLISQLRYHGKRHHGLKSVEPRLSYPCIYCPKVFNYVDTFKEHLSSAHPGIIPCKCPFCPRSYRIASCMARHVAKQHPNELDENRHSSKQPPTAVNSPEECQPEVSDSSAGDTSHEPAPDNIEHEKLCVCVITI